MSDYLAILLAAYLLGALLCWALWRKQMMVGWWVQDTITLLLWPLLIIIIPIVAYVKKDLP